MSLEALDRSLGLDRKADSLHYVSSGAVHRIDDRRARRAPDLEWSSLRPRVEHETVQKERVGSWGEQLGETHLADVVLLRIPLVEDVVLEQVSTEWQRSPLSRYRLGSGPQGHLSLQ